MMGRKGWYIFFMEMRSRVNLTEMEVVNHPACCLLRQ